MNRRGLFGAIAASAVGAAAVVARPQVADAEVVVEVDFGPAIDVGGRSVLVSEDGPEWCWIPDGETVLIDNARLFEVTVEHS